MLGVGAGSVVSPSQLPLWDYKWSCNRRLVAAAYFFDRRGDRSTQLLDWILQLCANCQRL